MSETIFALIGGEPAVRKLVDVFYDRMSSDPAYSGILNLHPEDLTGSRDKLFWFLCGWLGGPNLYIERFGHPRLRARHLPFPIRSGERDQWLDCMELAMSQCQVPEQLRRQLMTALTQTADWMRNRPET